MDDPYFGISTSSFSQKILSVLLHPVNELDVEIKPDGVYMHIAKLAYTVIR